MKLTPRGGVMLMAGGRVLLGAAVMAAPEQVVSRWLGEENAKSPALLDLARGLAARDIALGVATLQTLGDPVAGPRIQAACAVADLVDCGATVLAREHLPLKGAVGTVVVAGAAAVAGFWWAHRLAHA
jgi:hypothetical protein